MFSPESAASKGEMTRTRGEAQNHSICFVYWNICNLFSFLLRMISRFYSYMFVEIIKNIGTHKYDNEPLKSFQPKMGTKSNPYHVQSVSRLLPKIEFVCPKQQQQNTQRIENETMVFQRQSLQPTDFRSKTRAHSHTLRFA